MSEDLLFSPFTVNGLTLPNRFVMSAMTRNLSVNGAVTDETVDYYTARAKGGVALINTEVCTVNRPTAYSDPGMPRFYGEESEAAWRKVVDSVHQAGGLISVQIGHVGGTPNPLTNFMPEGEIDSVSGFDNLGEPLGSPMSESAIADVIATYAQAAADGKRLGFDALEIHGAHGGLMDQFAWSFTNRRTDRWGGSMRNRARFGEEVIRAMRAAVGTDFPIIVRLSQWKVTDFTAKVAPTPAELEEWVTPLADAGADCFHGSQRRFWEPEFEGSTLNFAGWLKKLTGKPAITVGSVGLDKDLHEALMGEVPQPRSLSDLYERMDKGEFDLVAVGRALLDDPEWVEKVRDQRWDELRAFDPKILDPLRSRSDEATHVG